MNLTEAQTQLTTIRDHLPPDYSQQAARRMMLSFENYRQVSMALGRSIARTKSGIRSTFEDIEENIRTAIKGTPKKEAGSAFSLARRQITEDIDRILAVVPPPSTPEADA